MDVALQHVSFDCSIARPPATPLRQESLGGFSAGASALSSGGFALSPLFWEELQGRRWLFTYDSALLLGGAVDAFFAHSSSDGGSADSGAAIDCQFTSSVVVMALAGHAPNSTGVALAAAKLALSTNRVLVVYSDDPLAPPAFRLTSAYGRRLIGAAAPALAAAGADDAAAFASSVGRLDAFLDWLRQSMGGARTRLPPPPPDAESPSVLASVRSSSSGVGLPKQLSASIFAVGAAGAPPLLVAPAALRKLLNRAAPAPVPVAAVPIVPAAPAAAAMGGAGAGSSGVDASAASAIGAKRSRGAYEAGHAYASGSSASASGFSSSGGASSSAAASAAASDAASTPVSLAIIVPYRSQAAQNRELQLRLFADYMPRFLARMCPAALATLLAVGGSSSAAGASAGAGAAAVSASSLVPLPHRIDDFHVIIVEQSEDGHKFNRGKLLNIGFAIASSPARAAAVGLGGRKAFTSFCFHDVDLLPQDALARWYAAAPARPIHIAAAWPRYFEKNKSYVGGITSFAGHDFARING